MFQLSLEDMRSLCGGKSHSFEIGKAYLIFVR
jgi:hypothetical protein